MPIVLAMIGMLAFGLAAFALGQSNNWDLCNYHWYDGWAWLTGRGDADLAAAQLQTWFNPLLPAALYALLSSLPPALGTFALGAVQGGNLVLAYLVARALLPGRPRWFVVVVAVVGVTGATQLGELGATFGDNLLTLFLLGALALVVERVDRPRALLAGLCVGVAVGIKLTVAPFAAGIVLALPALAGNRRDALALFACAAVAALCGFLASGGFWMLELWQRYGNPLFPLFGTWFGGDYAPPGGTTAAARARQGTRTARADRGTTVPIRCAAYRP
ncbi:MAG TPA: glycosyltransferase 87 family protein, partial [Tahibacter sp.]|nr:glycosyltransferase 87 family protein [Tahibacter sp.]